MDTDLLEPRSAYLKIYKPKHDENTNKYFDNLVKKSGINIEANRSTIKSYKDILSQMEYCNKKRNGQKALKTFLIVMTIILFLAATIFVFIGVSGGLMLWLSILIAVALVGGAVGFILLIVKINKKIKEFDSDYNELTKKKDELLKEAWHQMAPLNSLFDWNIPAKIINMDTDLIKLDEYFDGDKYTYLNEKFGLDDNTDPTTSCLLCQSGEMLGNPFLLCKDYSQSWYQHTYEGHLTIHWTTTVRTKNGTYVQHHTQTLTATITKPAPSYASNTYLVFGNEAAPNLSFSRSPSGASGLDDKKIEKMVKKTSKQLDKRARKELMDDDETTNYTRFGDDEFEVLFGGTNRDHEVDFNLLFTPLARKNLLDIIKNKEPFGDDFFFTKSKMLNFIQTYHSQRFDYDADPNKFVGFDYDTIKKNFIEYNIRYFENFYFELAPILSIPVYQQTKTHEYIYGTKFRPNLSTYEDEAIANKFDVNLLKPEGAATSSIIKAEYESKIGNNDKVKLIAHAFRTESHLDYVTVMGGDGKPHAVPVHWLEYIPVTKESYMAIQKKHSTRNNYLRNLNNDSFTNLLSKFSVQNGYRYERSLFSILLANDLSESDVKSLNNMFKDETLNDKIDLVSKEIKEINEAIELAEDSVKGNIQK